MAVVRVLNTGGARDPILATCARNVWLIAAIYKIEFIFSHIAGQVNNIAYVSRWSITPNPREELNQFLANHI